MVNMGELFNYDRISDQPCELVPLTTQEMCNCLLKAGDLLFARQSLTYDGAGRCVIVLPQSGPLTWESHLIRARLDPTVADPRYFYYYFRSVAGRRTIESIIQQVAAAGIRGSDLARLAVPKPPLPEQRSVAEVLEVLDDKIAAAAAASQSADSLASSIYRFYEAEAVGHPKSRLSQISTVVLGGTPSKANPDYWTHGTVPWLNSGKANETRIHEPSALITEAALRGSAAKLMPRHATVLAITGATLGQISRLELEACGNQSLVGVWARQDDLNDWIYFAIREHKSRLLERATGAAQQHINKADVESFAIPVPADTGLFKFAARVSPLLDLAASFDRAGIAAASLRDALLPELLSGRLQVKDVEKRVEAVV